MLKFANLLMQFKWIFINVYHLVFLVRLQANIYHTCTVLMPPQILPCLNVRLPWKWNGKWGNIVHFVWRVLLHRLKSHLESEKFWMITLNEIGMLGIQPLFAKLLVHNNWGDRSIFSSSSLPPLTILVKTRPGPIPVSRQLWLNLAW